MLAEPISIWCRNVARWFCQSCGSGVRRGRWPARAGLVSRCFTPRPRPTGNGLPFGNRRHPPEAIRHPFDRVERRNRTIAEAKVQRYCYRTASELKKHPQAFLLAYTTPNARMPCAASHRIKTGVPGGRKMPLISTLTRCIVPTCDGVFSGLAFRTELGDKYATAAPAPLRPYGPLSNVVRKAYKR